MRSLKLTEPKNTCRRMRENSPMPEPNRLGSLIRATRHPPRWLLLALLAAVSLSGRPRFLARCRRLCEVGGETAAHRDGMGVRCPRRPGREDLRLGQRSLLG